MMGEHIEIIKSGTEKSTGKKVFLLSNNEKIYADDIVKTGMQKSTGQSVGMLNDGRRIYLGKGNTVPGAPPRQEGTMEPVPDWGVKHPRLYGLYGAAKETAKEAGKIALEGGMMAAGAVGGTVMSGPVGGLTMGGLGYAGAKMIEDKLAGNEDARIRAGDFVLGAAMEGGAQGLAKGANYVKGRMVPTADDFALKGMYDKWGVTPLPSEIRAVPSRTLSVLESVLGYSPLSGDIMTRHAVRQLERYNNIRNNLIERGAPQKEVERIGSAMKREARNIIERREGKGYEHTKQLVDDFMAKYTGDYTNYSAGTSIRSLLESDLKARQGKVHMLYEETKEALGNRVNQKYPISEETANVAKRLLDEELAKVHGTQNSKVISVLRGFIPEEAALGKEIEESLAMMPERARAQVLQQIGAKETTPKEYSWLGLDKTRSELLERSREIHRASGGRGTNESRMYDEIISAIDDEMANIAKMAGKDVWAKHQAARKAARETFEIFDKDVLRIMNMRPDQVVNKIASGDIELLKQIEGSLGDDGIRIMRSVFSKNMFDKSLKKNGQLDMAKMVREINKLQPEVRDVLFTQDAQKNLAGIMKRANSINTRIFTNKAEAFEFLDTLTGVSNEKVIDYIFKPNNTRYITYAKRLLSPERNIELQEQALRKVLKATPEGNILPVQSLNKFKQYNEPLRKLLPDDLYRDVESFLKMAGHSKKIEAMALNASQTGQIFLGHQLLQMLLGAPVKLAGATGVPWAIAKIYVNPKARLFMKRALVAPEKEATGNFIRALEIAGADMMGED